MKLYHDESKAFYYIEKDGKWFESLYDEESSWVAIPAFNDLKHAGLVQDYLYSIDYPEWLTDCYECDNRGWTIDDGEIYECGCYHSGTDYSYEKFIGEINLKTMRFHNV